jgi:hypothetical protein
MGDPERGNDAEQDQTHDVVSVGTPHAVHASITTLPFSTVAG